MKKVPLFKRKLFKKNAQFVGVYRFVMQLRSRKICLLSIFPLILYYFFPVCVLETLVIDSLLLL